MSFSPGQRHLSIQRSLVLVNKCYKYIINDSKFNKLLLNVNTRELSYDNVTQGRRVRPCIMAGVFENEAVIRN